MEHSPLFTYLYHYILGGVLFLVGLVLAYRSGALNLRTAWGRFWLLVLVGGLLLYMAGHAWLQFQA